ncbi:YdcF family protein [Mesobacillus jeotgali]|uniref:YdcF family protein n=1 Tax=Mesobacillus jeotgali TaxID=129985 RepID=UPI0009A82DEF|nr:YdcF family protein [Mesobacillus jeotgali]
MKSKMVLKKWLIAGMSLSLLYGTFLHYQIIRHANEEVPRGGDYMIILGARVKGSRPSLALQFRIDYAAEYLKDNPQTIAIASGGKGPGEDFSEAEAIKKKLVEYGIEESRILLEDKSTNTYENIGFSKKLIPKEAKTGLLVTNDFHIYRAQMIAENEGLMISGLPAKTPIQAVFKSYLREYLALTKYFIITAFR